MHSGRLVLVLHVGNAAAYPPLVQAMRALTDAGYRVALVDVDVAQTQALTLPNDLAIAHQRVLAVGSRWGRILGYIRAATRAARRHRPIWVLASNPPSLPAANLVCALSGARLLYQEHDSPEPQQHLGMLARGAARLRQRVLRRAPIVVFPNAGRLARWRTVCGPGHHDLVVWNLPPRDEVGPPRSACAGASLLLHFHGSMSEFALPLAVLEALAQVPEVALQFASFEFDARDHTGAVLAHAERLGISDRLHNLGTIGERDALLSATRRADIGLCFFSDSPKNINHSNMAGASNKVFDYLAAGLALLCTDGAQWQPEFVPVYGRAANPNDAASIASALRAFVADRVALRAMGERGRQKIAQDWHFERAFAPVLAAMAAVDGR